MSKSSYSLFHFHLLRLGIPVLMNVSRKNPNFHGHVKFLSGKSTMLKSRISLESWLKKEKYTLALQQRVQMSWRAQELYHQNQKSQGRVSIRIPMMYLTGMNYSFRAIACYRLAMCISLENRQMVDLMIWARLILLSSGEPRTFMWCTIGLSCDSRLTMENMSMLLETGETATTVEAVSKSLWSHHGTSIRGSENCGSLSNHPSLLKASRTPWEYWLYVPSKVQGNRLIDVINIAVPRFYLLVWLPCCQHVHISGGFAQVKYPSRRRMSSDCVSRVEAVTSTKYKNSK